ncbi:MAG TPA: 2-C-methyl-D-erythritol 4-phosphate cytidylyltransferase [Hanamia sp.]|jgi:2-C-methyl-D-erythritol 4-phosphate cytidylyltransferase|nr:2-C-methyl-D-erythritol 4-phosphate cytidylyltransferase [Hanamia sp.]
MKKIALIVAGGNGTRMKNDIPKQFLFLKNKPILYYSIKVFLDTYDDIEIILVLPEEHIGKGQEIVDGYFDATKIIITAGGRTRFHSVKNGLALVKDEAIIFVHDGVRCLLTKDLIKKCYEAALELGNAIPAVDCSDSVRMLTSNGNKIIDRKKIKLIQTPQTFHSKILLPAYQIDYKDQFTDEATVVEAFGLKVNLIEGEKDNIKITTPGDLIFADLILENILKEI